MITLTRRALVASLLLVAAPVAAAQGLLVVDAAGGPGSQFTSIADAVAAAPDGGTVLVREGQYDPFVIDGKTLIVVAAPGDEVFVYDGTPASVTVRNVAPAQVVVFEGLSFSASGPQGLLVEDCAGQVWIQRCTAFNGAVALRVLDSDQVIVVRSLIGPEGLGEVHGLHAEQSRVFVYESDLHGGHALPDISGGDGAHVIGGLLFAEGSKILGGGGISGGAGMELSSQARAITFDSAVGNVVTQGGATWEVLPGASGSFSVDSPYPDGEATTLHFEGEPGDTPLVLVATAVGPAVYFSKFKGVVATGNPFLLVLPALPASGTLDVPLDVGDALPDGSASTIFLQGGLLKASGGGVLMDPATLTTLDE